MAFTEVSVDVYSHEKFTCDLRQYNRVTVKQFSSNKKATQKQDPRANIMEKPIILLLVATILLLLLSAEQTSGSFFSSLQFTRESLMGFSRGSERMVEILTPSKTTKTVSMKSVVVKAEKTKKTKSFSKVPKGLVRRTPPPTELIPITETVVTYQNKRKVYRQRSSPSNKFLEALNDIERAVVNAKASGIRFSDRTLARLKALVERALRGKSYKYARQVRHHTFAGLFKISFLSSEGCQCKSFLTSYSRK